MINTTIQIIWHNEKSSNQIQNNLSLPLLSYWINSFLFLFFHLPSFFFFHQWICLLILPPLSLHPYLSQSFNFNLSPLFSSDNSDGMDNSASGRSRPNQVSVADHLAQDLQSFSNSLSYHLFFIPLLFFALFSVYTLSKSISVSFFLFLFLFLSLFFKFLYLFLSLSFSSQILLLLSLPFFVYDHHSPF